MNAANKLHGLLGMARRAGKLNIGFDAALDAIKDGKSDTVLIALDGSPKTEKECRFVCSVHGGDVYRLPLDKALLSAAIGASKPVAVLAVCDAGFAKTIRSYCTDNKEEDSL